MNKLFKGADLKVKLWTYFAFFAAVIMIVLWLLQIIFFQTYYVNMKIKEVEKIGNDLVASFTESDFENNLYQLTFKKGLFVRFFNNSGVLENRNNSIGNIRGFRGDQHMMQSLVEQIESSPDKKIVFPVVDEGIREQIVIYGAKLPASFDNPVYIQVFSILAPVDSTISILQNQLIFVTIISLILAFFLSYFFARRISKPISRLTKAAGILANGNYNVVFEGGNYKEINDLSAALNESARKLSITEQLRRDLIANVSHDLRTPLTIIKSYTEMIRDLSGDNPEKRKLHTKVIVDETDRLTSLVNDLLDLSKIESGTENLNISEFNITESIRHILQSLNVFSENEGYVFDFKADDDIIVQGDEQRIKQAAYNLIINAVYHTGEDKTVNIEIENGEDSAKVIISDTGKGIKPEELSKVWERYYQTSDTGKRSDTGSGIGLSIVRGILKLHGAVYGVESLPGKGASFWFILKK